MLHREILSPLPPSLHFNPTTSAMADLYVKLGASTPLELSNKFTELDQKQMESGGYDYADKESAVNELKARLEELDPASLTEEENEWRDEMLWLWHHHAAGFALFSGHREDAQRLIETALSYQAADHPNKFSGLILLMAHDDVEAAEEYISTAILPDSVEYQGALGVLESFKQLRKQEKVQKDIY